jgi:hypothetical protein
MSKFGEFLEKEKINPKRLLAASHRVETLRPEDRTVRFAKARVRDGKATDAQKEQAAKQARSGRPVTQPTIDRAVAGKAVPAKAKQRIVRAINHIRAQRKQPEVASADLF